jgi:hypothetical protein
LKPPASDAVQHNPNQAGFIRSLIFLILKEEKMINQPIPTNFNPDIAAAAYEKAWRRDIQAQEIKDTIASDYGQAQQLGKRTIGLFISGQVKRTSIQEHIAELEEDMNAHWEQFKAAGGEQALHAFMYGSVRGVSYAGEIPTWTNPAPRRDSETFPTLP